jgi:hypothetical protein
MTAHKAQGQTLEKVIIDLESCRGTESPYVMVSRVTSIKGLLILRPFKFAKIKCNQSQDTRKEFSRLNRLRLHTIAKIGSAEEQKDAQAALLNECRFNIENMETETIEPQTRQTTQHKKVKIQLLERTDQQTNVHITHSETPIIIKNPTMLQNSTPISKCRKRLLEGKESTHKRRRSK